MTRFKLALIAALIALFPAFSFATDLIIGTSISYNTTTGYPCPYANFYKNSRDQYLLTADELSQAGAHAGIINSLAFNVYARNNCQALPNYTLKMAHTSLNVLTTSFVTDLTTVYTAASYLPFVGWNVHEFQEPFTWNGTDNIVIETIYSLTSSYTQNASVYYSSTSPHNRTLSYKSDSVNASTVSTGTLFTNRPNIMLSISSSAHVNLISPADGAAGVDPETLVLSWEPNPNSPSPIYYEVFMGASPINPGSNYWGEHSYTTSSASTFNLYEYLVLPYLSTFYWAVIPYYSGGGPDPLSEDLMIFSFQTKPSPPQILLSPSSLSSAVNFGDSEIKYLNINNPGGSELSFDILISTASGVEWASATPTSDSIASGAEQQIEILFDSTGLSPGNHQGSLIITNNAGLPVLVPLELTVLAVHPPNLSVEPGNWDFGEIFTGLTVSKELILTNTGGGMLYLDTESVSMNSDPEGNFEISDINLPITLYRNQSYAVNVDFSPQGLGSKSAFLVFCYNGNQELSVNLSGIGIAEPTGQVINLQAQVFAKDNVELSWVHAYDSVGAAGWIHYDDDTNWDGIGTGTAQDFKVAIKFSSAYLYPLAGKQLTRIKFFPKSANASYKIMIWSGLDGSVRPNTIVYEQSIANPQINQWNEVELNSPISISGSQALWIGYSIQLFEAEPYVYYPAGCDAGPASSNFGDLIELSGVWYSLSTQWGFNYNWNIQVFVDEARGMASSFPLAINVSNPGTEHNRDLRQVLKTQSGRSRSRNPKGFNIFRNGVQLNSTLLVNSQYLDSALPSGSHSYTVQAVYQTHNSDISDPVLLQILPALPISLPFVEHWDSNAYVTNDWYHSSTNWDINSNGNPAPAARFFWTPPMQDYSSVLISDRFNGQNMNNILLTFDLALNNFSLESENFLAVEIWDGSIWQRIRTFSSLTYPNLHLDSWQAYSCDISTHAANRIFKMRFLAMGEDSYHINYWLIDNITLCAGGQSSLPSAPQNVQLSFASEAGTLSWDPVLQDIMGNPVSGIQYKVYSSPSPDFECSPANLLATSSTETYILPGWISSTRARFFKVKSLRQ